MVYTEYTCKHACINAIVLFVNMCHIQVIPQTIQQHIHVRVLMCENVTNCCKYFNVYRKSFHLKSTAMLSSAV